MKKTVKYSGGSWMFTVALCVMCISFSIIYFRDIKTVKAIILSSCFALYIIFALFYAPVSLTVTDRYLKVRRPLKSRIILINDIASVELFSPTLSERRVLGSGGFFGYWGWFSERTVGKYFAYYGRSSDCFIVKLRNGRQYVLGCVDAPKVVEFIQGYIK